MNTKEVVSYISIHKLSADECQQIMNALLHQNEVLTGDIVLKKTLYFLAEATCEEMRIRKENVAEVKERAKEIFADHLRYGTEGDIDDLMEMSVNQACEDIINADDD